eukprot:11707180-Alexandrium_andersonii.AAC.1
MLWLHGSGSHVQTKACGHNYVGSSFRVEEKDTVHFDHCTRVRASAIVCYLSTHCFCWDCGFSIPGHCGIQ